MCHGDTGRTKMILFIIIIICILLVVDSHIISNRIAYKKLCQLEENEEMSIEAKLERMKVYAIEIHRTPQNYTILKKYDELLCKYQKQASINKPMGEFFTIISYGMNNEPTVVYDNETLVMYAVSNTKDENGFFTMLVNSDGSPKTYNKNLEVK